MLKVVYVDTLSTYPKFNIGNYSSTVFSNGIGLVNHFRFRVDVVDQLELIFLVKYSMWLWFRATARN